MKKCPKCLVEKPLHEFSVATLRKDGRQPYCKACRAVIDHELYERRVGRSVPRHLIARSGNRAWLVSLKQSRPCTDCGKTYPPQAMQWDHLPGSPKVGDVSALMRLTRAELLEEIAKCELVCVNCHTMRTVRRRSISPIHEDPWEYAA